MTGLLLFVDKTTSWPCARVKGVPRTKPPSGDDAPAGARQATLRATNLALVTRHVFAVPEPVSRADVAAATGMTRSTASRLADELVAAGIVEELEPAPARGPGRPAIPLIPARGSVIALGLEVNVTHLAVRAVDLAGNVVADRITNQDLSDSDPTLVLRSLACLIERVLRLEAVAHCRVVGAALALPGLVLGDTLLRAPNLGWHDLTPAAHLSSALDGIESPLRLGNEANFAALTAARLRPAGPEGAGGTDFIYVSGENGIGAGLVRDGSLVRGRHGFAGEVGHVLVDPRGPRCGCGNRGCVELYAGRRAILRAAGLDEGAQPEDLLRALDDGAPAAHEALALAARALGIGIGAAINILDAPTVVLGGHLAPLAEALRPALEEELEHRVLASKWTPVAVLAAPDDEAPGATGAAWSLLEEIVADPATWI